MQDYSQDDICSRIRALRIELDGARGKASFAKKLDLSASTYDYYESSRVPPADVLVRIADIAQVDLRWLITGQAAQPAISPAHPALRRVAEMLAQQPNAAKPLLAFLDILAQSMAFPASAQGGAGVTAAISPAVAPSAAQPQAAQPGQGVGSPGPVEEAQGAAPAKEGRENWIPVLGRSAAGVAHFWADDSQGRGLTVLGDLVERWSRQGHGQSVPAASDDEGPLAIISLSRPGDDNVTEFVASSKLKAQFPDAFAVRIDGESMAPDIHHGDLVILSPTVQAVDGKAAVVQLANQIGVTCKLFRRAGQEVHLVPVNEQFPPQMFSQSQVVWALKVLARIRRSG